MSCAPATFWGVPVKVRKSWRARGDAGAMQTLAEMRAMVQRSAVEPEIVSLARVIVRPAARGDRRGAAGLVRDWVSRHTRWTPDPEGAEYLVPPTVMLSRIARAGLAPGDCDDVAVLAATLLKAAGIPARLTAIGFHPTRRLSHVTAEAMTGPGVWRELDTTRPAVTDARPARALALRV